MTTDTERAHGTKQSPEYITPPWLMDGIRKLLGVEQIGLDPCTREDYNEHSVKADVILTKEDDGLSVEWWAETCFVNPPGGRSRAGQQFWKKLEHDFRKEQIEQAVFLAFSLDYLQTAQNHTPGGMLTFPVWIPSKRIPYYEIGPDGELRVALSYNKKTKKETPAAMKPSCLAWLPPAGIAAAPAMRDWATWMETRYPKEVPSSEVVMAVSRMRSSQHK